ncbi:uncharacterized protein METZ01_LOCUS290992 [marine metagenome]|uniref:Uncharacterized protein n=1 Tax=marine metagenome TaxID=408172 RepID=A0A382LN27_9ZZZZ
MPVVKKVIKPYPSKDSYSPDEFATVPVGGAKVAFDKCPHDS